MLLNVIFQKLIFDAVVADAALKPQQENPESLAFRKERSTLNRLQYCEIPLPVSLRLPRKGSSRLRR